jgi:membrane-associated protein
MEFLTSLLDFVLHINAHLDQLVVDYGSAIYAILFLIIFVETGLVIMPFLPGDSLLFAAGAICARPGSELSVVLLIGLLFLAAVLGDNVNYAIGRFAGAKVVNLQIRGKSLVKQAYIDKTHSFFEKYGTKAIIMARFVPIVRTFTPFVAGVGKMEYRKKFLPFDLAGGFLWICSMTLAGYFLGNLEFFQKHFEAVVIGIVLLSVMPMVVAYLRHRFSAKA